MNRELSPPAPRFNLRAWATPSVLGAMVISSVTGVLLFFEADTGFAKLAHQWLGWLLVIGAIAHAYTNRAALGAHLRGVKGRVVLAVFVLTTIAVIVPLPRGGRGEGGVDPPTAQRDDLRHGSGRGRDHRGLCLRAGDQQVGEVIGQLGHGVGPLLRRPGEGAQAVDLRRALRAGLDVGGEAGALVVAHLPIVPGLKREVVRVTHGVPSPSRSSCGVGTSSPRSSCSSLCILRRA